MAVSAYPGDLAVANGTAYVAGLHSDRLDAVSLGQDSDPVLRAVALR